LNFDEVKVPVENLIGEEGKGFYYLMGGLQVERLAGAISAISGSEHALEYTMQYMSEREAFGRSINKFQVLRHRIAQLAAEIESTKAFVYLVCKMEQDGQYAVKESSMAKLLATELSDKVMTQCLQCFGGYGYMEEYKIARMFRDSRVGTIGGGSSEIMREIIAKMVIDEKSYQKADPGEQASATKASFNHQPQAAQAAPSGGLAQILSIIEKRAAQAKALGSRLKFDFGDQHLLLDGYGPQNQVSTENGDADCTVALTLTDFEAMMQGKLNPMTALMSGKMEIKGDMGVAMKLQGILGGK
jgi:acyl-CoA dehydrogenase